ncbi:hypothetical protein HCQ94_04985 [Actinomyces sp. zg-332]|uniref:hypothetical protein n=1 Tax=Actinomyces sp. zg-332 TaxID=2708340 RepID=UPI00141E21AB|nr:hypothetical protein [Actinomyces sp. zg-332]QPK93932.1 hypothetical protein HCQ94_04985 [Actinomyces sp. zg-332]
MLKKNSKEKKGKPNRFVSGLVVLAIFLLVPLPFALWSSGWEWITKDWTAVPSEFIITYVGGLIFFLGSIIAYIIRGWLIAKGYLKRDEDIDRDYEFQI